MATLSKRSGRLYASPVREILKVIERPGMISFAGGLPSTESFPDVSLQRVEASMLQYGESEGEPALRDLIAAELAERGLDTSPERVIVLSGSQQGIDLAAKLFIDPGTPVAVESPTYLAALQVFDLFGAEFRPFTPARPAQMFECGSKPTLAYAIPTFQNPTGHCYDDGQRNALAQLCVSSGTTLFEDDPYRELAYDVCERRPVCARMLSGSWIYQSSFSKTLAPGLRLGYLTSTPDLFPYLSRLKQAADLHSARLSQHVLLQLASTLRSPGRRKYLRAAYRAEWLRFCRILKSNAVKTKVAIPLSDAA